MFCQKCGNQIPDGSACCNFCGASQQAKSSGFENGSQPAQQVNPPVVPPVAPPPAPKKNNNILLIVIIAILAVVTVVAAMVIAKPDIFDSGSSSSSQSEEKDDKKNDDEDKSEKETVTQKEDVPTDAEDAEAELDYFLSCFYDPYSDEVTDLFTANSAGISAETMEVAQAFYADVLYYYDYEIIGYEEDGDVMVFTVDIDTVDFYSIIDDMRNVTAEIAADSELAEELLTYDDVTRGFYMWSLVFDECSPDIETVTVEVEMVCKGNGDWVVTDNGNSVMLGVLNNFNDAVTLYAQTYQ